MFWRSACFVLIMGLLGSACARVTTDEPANKTSTPATDKVAADCTTCAAVFEDQGWDLTDLPKAIQAAIKDSTSAVTCFVPPKADESTLKLRIRQLGVEADSAEETQILAQMLSYHVVTSGKLPFSPSTTSEPVRIETSASTKCGANTVILNPSTTAITLIDGADNQVPATLVSKTCKNTAAYTIPQFLLPCEDLKVLVAEVTGTKASPGADKPTDPAAGDEPAASPAKSKNSPAPKTNSTPKSPGSGVVPSPGDNTGDDETTGDPSSQDCRKYTNCLARALCEANAGQFAELLMCAKLLNRLTQGKTTYTLITPNDDAIQQSNVPLSCSSVADSAAATQLASYLTYYIIEEAQTFAALAKQRRVATKRTPTKDCAAVSLSFNNPLDGGDTSSTGEASRRSSAVVDKEVGACPAATTGAKKLTPTIMLQVISRPLVTCCTERSDDVKKLLVSRDPNVAAFVSAFATIATKDSSAEGTLFLPSLKGIQDFLAQVKAANGTLSSQQITWIAEFHFTRTIIQLEDVDRAASKADQSVLGDDTTQQLCGADDDSWKRIMVTRATGSDGGSITSNTVPPGRYIIDTGVTNATITSFRTNCRGRIYSIDNVLLPCEVPGLFGQPASTPPLGSSDPLGGILNPSPGTTNNSNSLLGGGNGTGFGGLGDLSSSSSSGSAAGSRATLLHLSPLLLLLLAAAY